MRHVGTWLAATAVAALFALTVHTQPVHAGVVTFEPNGGRGTMEQVTLSASEQLPVNQFTRYGYVFRGWARNPQAASFDLEDQAKIGTDMDVTLYALWEPQLYIIRYDKNGGFGDMPDSYGIYGQKTPLSKSKYSHKTFRFDGWVDFMGRRYGNGGSVLNLHSGNTFSKKILTVDAGSPLDKTHRFRSTQGSVVYEEDGREYLITAASINDSAYYKGDLSHYETILTKYDVKTGEVVATARNIPFDHGNGICYNENNGHIYVAEGGTLDEYPSGVMELDSNLQVVREWNFPLLTHVWAIAYADHHFYVIGRNLNSRNTFCTLNEQMQTLSYTEVDAYYDQHFSSQGIATDGSFIYAVSAGFKAYEWKTKQRINVFTIDGRYVGVWGLDIPYEAEDISVIGEYAYITTNEGAKASLYRTKLPIVTMRAVWVK